MASNSAFELGIGLDYQATYNAVLQGFTKIADAVEKQIRITPNIDTADLQKKLQTAFKNVQPLQMQVDAVFANQKGGDAAKILGADFMAQMQGLYQRRQELQQQLRNSTSDIDKAYNAQHLAEVNAEYRKLLLTYQQATTAANALKEAEAAAVAQRADAAAQQEADAYLAKDAENGRKQARAKWEAFLAEEAKYEAEERARQHERAAENIALEAQIAKEAARQEASAQREADAWLAQDAENGRKQARAKWEAFLAEEERYQAEERARQHERAAEDIELEAQMAKEAAKEKEENEKRLRQLEEERRKAALEAERAQTQAVTHTVDRIGQYITRTLLLGVAMRTMWRALREGVQAVRDIDSALTQLQVVTGASASTLQEYTKGATAAARASGNAVTDIMKSTETYARLGYTLDESLEMASVTARYANVAATTTNEATTAITAILKGFGLEASESEHVADILTAVGARYAISAGELGEALENGGAAMAAAGNSLEESVAILAAANAAVQNPRGVGKQHCPNTQ